MTNDHYGLPATVTSPVDGDSPAQSGGSSPPNGIDHPSFDFDLDFDGELDIKDETIDGKVIKGRRSKRPPSTAERKATHNAVERARRESLNGRFMELASVLPTMAHVKRPSKAVIVNKSLQYIHDSQIRENLLVKENNELRNEVNELRSRLGMPPLPPSNVVSSAPKASVPNFSPFPLNLSQASHLALSEDDRSPLIDSPASLAGVAPYDPHFSYFAAPPRSSQSMTPGGGHVRAFTAPSHYPSEESTGEGSDVDSNHASSTDLSTPRSSDVSGVSAGSSATSAASPDSNCAFPTSSNGAQLTQTELAGLDLGYAAYTPYAPQQASPGGLPMHGQGDVMANFSQTWGHHNAAAGGTPIPCSTAYMQQQQQQQPHQQHAAHSEAWGSQSYPGVNGFAGLFA